MRLLPMAHIRSRLTGHRLASLPFAHICGPIADTEATLYAMVDRAFSICEELNCRYTEFRKCRPANPYFIPRDQASCNIYFSNRSSEEMIPRSVTLSLDAIQEGICTSRNGTILGSGSAIPTLVTVIMSQLSALPTRRSLRTIADNPSPGAAGPRASRQHDVAASCPRQTQRNANYFVRH